MAARGTSRLFAGIQLDDVGGDADPIFPARPVLASDGTSESSNVFSTPKSQVTPQVDEDEGGRGLSKVGLFCVGDADDICGGVVGKIDGEGGGAARFCTRPKKECRYVTHRENKALIEDQTYYIKTPRAHTARLHPSLSMLCLQVPSEDDDSHLEDRLQTMDVWVTYLNAINAHEAMNLAGLQAARKPMAVTGLHAGDESVETPTDSTWERVFAPSLSTFVRDVAALKTPGRPVKRRVDSAESDDMTDEDPWVISDVEAIAPEPSQDLTDRHPDLSMIWCDLMARNWNKVRSNVLGLGKVLSEGKKASREGLEVVDQELSSISNKIAFLDTRIGVNPTSSGTSGIVSVWEAVEDVVLDGRALGTKFTDVEKRQLAVERVTKETSQERERIRVELDALVLNFDRLADNYTENIIKLQTKLLVLEKDKRTRITQESLNPMSLRMPPGEDYSVLHDRFELQINKLREDGVRVWRQLQELQGAREAEMMEVDPRGGHSRHNPIPVDMTNSKSLEILESRMDIIESNRGGVVFATHKFKFTSQHDVERFIEEKRVESCGTYWDLFSILVRMGGKKQSGHQLGQTTFAATRVQMTTLELDLLSSMSFERPIALFVTDAVEMDTLKCSSYENWVGVGLKTSVSGTITNDVTKFVSGIRGALRFQSGDTSLAMTLLDNVEIQYNKLVAFIEKFFKELTTVANFPVESAWKLIGRCLGGFFQTMVATRSEIALLEEARTIDTKAQVIWTVLQCHAIVEQFIKLDFKGHTIMVQQMTLYMMTERVDPAQMVKQAATVETGHKAVQEALKLVKQLSDTVDKLKVEAATSKRKVDDVANQMETLKKKVNAGKG
jgi:hypothetical protein